MSHFREILNKFNETKLNINEAAIAVELDGYDDLHLTEQEFESACNYLYDYLTHSEIGVQELVRVFVAALKIKEFTITDCDIDEAKVDNAIYNLL